MNGEVIPEEDENPPRCCDDCVDCCNEANPTLDMPTAKAVLVLNIFLPGVGTLVAAYRSLEGFNYRTLCSGIFQILLIALIAGIIWSIVQAIQIYQKSKEH